MVKKKKKRLKLFFKACNIDGSELFIYNRSQSLNPMPNLHIRNYLPNANKKVMCDTQQFLIRYMKLKKLSKDTAISNSSEKS